MGCNLKTLRWKLVIMPIDLLIFVREVSFRSNFKGDIPFYTLVIYFLMIKIFQSYYSPVLFACFVILYTQKLPSSLNTKKKTTNPL